VGVQLSEDQDEARLIALIVCDEMYLETDGHKSPRHMMSRLMADRVPIVRTLTLFARFLAPEGPLRVDAQLVDPHGEQLWPSNEFTSTVNPGGNDREYGRRSEATLSHFGRYEVRLIVNGQIVGFAPLSVWQAPPFVHLVDRSGYCGGAPKS
jgi:hypothetical protein